MHFPTTLAKIQESEVQVRLFLRTDFMYLPAETLRGVSAFNYLKQ